MDSGHAALQCDAVRQFAAETADEHFNAGNREQGTRWYQVADAADDLAIMIRRLRKAEPRNGC